MAISNNPEPAINKYFPGVQLESVGNDLRINPSPECGHNDCCTISPGHPVIHCFSCGKSATLFNYLKEYSGVQEKELIEFLCQTYGIEPPDEAEIRLQAIRKAAVYFYHDMLMGSPEDLKMQIEGRKHSVETLKTYQIGLVKNYGQLQSDLRGQGYYSMDEIKLANIYAPDGLHIYPYSNRSTGEIVRFNTKNPREITNDLGKIISGYSMGRKWFYTTPTLSDDYVILCEGENDLLSLYEAGFTSIIATGGNISDEQLDELSHMLDRTNKIYLWFDNDSAGAGYLEKVNAKLSHKMVYQVNYAGKDPDELLKKSQVPVDVGELIKDAQLLDSTGYSVRQKGSQWWLLTRDFEIKATIKERSKKGIFNGDVEITLPAGGQEGKPNCIISNYRPKSIEPQFIYSLHKELESFYDGQMPKMTLDQLIDCHVFTQRQDLIVKRMALIIKKSASMETDISKVGRSLGTVVKDQVLQEINELEYSELDPNEIESIPKIKMGQSFSHIHDEAMFYFTRLMNEDGSIVKIPCMVSSKKEIVRLDLIKSKNPQSMLLVNKKYELPFEVPTAISELQETSLSQRWVDSYIANDISRDNLQPHVQIKILEREVKRFFYSPDLRVYKIMALWIYGTYAAELFGEYPYLYLSGKKGSGKSTTDNVIYAYAFNAKFAVQITEAALFRTISSEGGTFIMDEMENLTSKKTTQDSGMASLLKGGYSKNTGRVYRCNPDKGNALEKFTAYGPKVISNINGLESVIYDRVLEIQMKEVPSEHQGKLEAIEDHLEKDHAKIREITSHCCLSVMENFKMIYAQYKATLFKGTTARMSQIMRPLKTLAHIAGPDFEDALEGYYQERIKSSKVEVEESTSEGSIKKILTEVSMELLGMEDFGWLKLIEEASLPRNCNITEHKDGFSADQLWLKFAMESNSPGTKYPVTRIHRYLKNSTGAKPELDELKRKTITLYATDMLSKELGLRFQVRNYRFYFKDYVKDWESLKEVKKQGGKHPKSNGVAGEPSALLIEPAGNQVLLFELGKKTNDINLDGEF